MKGIKKTGQFCECGQELTSWYLRSSKSLGWKPSRCEKCLATEYAITVDEFRGKLEDFYGMRPCQGL